MKICGITAEYNPFHKGHAYQIEKARQAGATHILAVMSGNFVQRGVPAMLDKWVRVRAALSGGADLVVELPLPFATASAETFAYGALSLMQATGCVDMVSFGAEDEQAQLQKVLSVLLSPEFEPVFRLRLMGGGRWRILRERKRRLFSLAPIIFWGLNISKPPIGSVFPRSGRRFPAKELDMISTEKKKG